MIKKALNISMWLLILLAIGATVYWSNHRFNRQQAGRVHVSMASLGPQSLLNSKDIEQRLDKTADSALLHQALGELAADSIEKLLSSDAHLSKVATYVGLDGHVYVHTQARKMQLRIFNQQGQSFYISDDARVVNPSIGRSQDCLVVSGHLPSLSQQDKLNILMGHKALPDTYQELLDFSHLISQDSFLSALIGQIYVHPKGDITLSPRTGVKSIIFGSLKNSREKLKKLKIFYTHSAKKVDWQAYKALNLKYHKQVVCIRK